MGRLIALVLGGFGLAAYLRRRRARRDEALVSPASELRERLAASRAAEPAPEPQAVAPEPAAEPEPQAPREPEPEPRPLGELDTRRRDVHDRARGAIDELS